MSTLKIGRISLTVDPEDVTFGGSSGLNLTTRFTSGTSLAATRAQVDEIGVYASSPGIILPVTWDGDTMLDGFYRVNGGAVEWLSMAANGYAALSLSLERLGTEARIGFQSVLSGKVLANDHSFTSGSALVGLPIGAMGYIPVRTGITRTTDAGNQYVITDVLATDHPRWYVTPAAFYTGACVATVGGYTRVGKHVANDPDGWTVSNGLVRISPGTSGAIEIDHYDGTDWRTNMAIGVYHSGATVGDWWSATLTRNDAERIVIRLDQQRGSRQGLITLYLGLRRGSRNVDGVYLSDNSALLKIQTGDPGTTTGSPTGTIKDAANDAFGHRWMLGSELTTSFDTTNGGISLTGYRLPFIATKVINHTAPATGDDDDDLWNQYMQWLNERVRHIVK